MACKKVAVPRYVEVEPFDCEIAILASEEECKAFCDSLGVEREYAVSGSYGEYILHEQDGVVWHGIYIATDAQEKTIWHECLHAAWGVLASAGVEVTFENHEVLAHMQGYIARLVKGALVDVNHKAL